MVDRGIFQPVLPEIDHSSAERLAVLVRRETQAGIQADALRRLAALLPADPEHAAGVAARLRLSNRAAKRLVNAAGREVQDADRALALAYQVGACEAADRILLGNGDPTAAAQVLGWARPSFPLRGGDLIRMGLQPGPVVARTLQAAERAWVEQGFRPVRKKSARWRRPFVDQALRDSQ
jgi:poly(A) polymerase